MSTVGERLDLVIEGLSHAGEGVGRADGMAVFVPKAIPGDHVQARIISTKKTYARGLIEDILRPSSERQEPPCRYASDCGGCQLQHMAYAGQLYWKREQVRDALERIGGLAADVEPVRGMAYPFRYRNKAQFPVQLVNGELAMGFYRPRTHELIAIDDCLIQHELSMQTALAVKHAATVHGMAAYDESTHQGVLRHVVTRVSVSNRKSLAVLVTRTAGLRRAHALASILRQQVPRCIGLVQNVNPDRTNAVFGPDTRMLWGEGSLRERIGHCEFSVSPRSFFQVNSEQAAVLFALVGEVAELTGNETVWDLYCGTGTLGLYLAKLACQVVGVESVPEAVADAQRNADLNQVHNARFVLGKAEKEIGGLSQATGGVDVVLLDPPRKGCAPELLKALQQARPRRIVYVSCNSSSLARDLRVLVDGGYQLGRVVPVDLFPQTSHIEVVVVLS